jgi:hypothetical protein
MIASGRRVSLTRKETERVRSVTLLGLLGGRLRSLFGSSCLSWFCGRRLCCGCFYRCFSWRGSRGWRGRHYRPGPLLPFLLSSGRRRSRRDCCIATRSGRCFGGASSPGGGRGGRGWRRRSQGLEELKNLRPGTQFPVQQEQEGVVRDLGVFGQLRSDVQLRHFG